MKNTGNFEKFFWNREGFFCAEKSEKCKFSRNNMEILENSDLNMELCLENKNLENQENLENNSENNSLNFVQRANSKLYLKIPLWQNEVKIERRIEMENLSESEFESLEFENQNGNQTFINQNQQNGNLQSQNAENWQILENLNLNLNLETESKSENEPKNSIKNHKIRKLQIEKPQSRKSENLPKKKLNNLEKTKHENLEITTKINSQINSENAEINLETILKIVIWQMGNCTTEIQLFGRIEAKTQIKITIWQMGNCAKVKIKSGFLVVNKLELEAKIVIKAENCEAEFTSHNLLLAKAEAKIWPVLEIHKAPKKCTHGATISTFDDNSIKYLQTRRISKESAKKLLENYFLDEFLDKFGN